MRLLERLGIVVASFAIAIAVIVALSGGPLAGRDNPGLSGPGGQLGTQYRDLGDAHLAPGAPRPHYDSRPPTSGAHVAAAVRHDERQLSDDQLLQALSLGDVVVIYGTRRPPPGLRSLAAANGGRFSPALAASGQAVILAPRPGTHGLLALAWTRMLPVADASDPRLHDFIVLYLGQGAPPSHN
jgi:Protein of unknown function (DUF3105)